MPAGHQGSFNESAVLGTAPAFQKGSFFMKLITALSTAAFETAPAVCKTIQRAAARGVSLADDIADVFGASQAIMREIVEHHRQNGGDGKYLDDVGTASHRHNPESS
jgi:hypothetical protein